MRRRPKPPPEGPPHPGRSRSAELPKPPLTPGSSRRALRIALVETVDARRSAYIGEPADPRHLAVPQLLEWIDRETPHERAQAA